MFNKELARKIDKLIKEKFPIIYDFDFNGIVLTWGGSIRNTMMNISVKDLDFVILTQDKCRIIEFIKKFKLSFYINDGGGYKIFYNGFSIDMSSTDDLLDAAHYDVDLLFYDINVHQFIVCGAMKSFEKGIMTQINFMTEPIKKDKIRYKKIAKFIKYISGVKKVKIKRNKFLWHRRMVVKSIRLTLNKIFRGYYSKCFRFFKKCKKKYILSTVLNLLIMLIYVVFPFFFVKIMINIFNNDKDIINIIILVSLKFLYFILTYCVSKLELSLFKNMEYNINKEIANSTLNFNKINDTKYSFLNLLKDDSGKVWNNFKMINNMLIDSVGSILIVLIVLVLNYKIGIVFVSFLLLAFIIKMKTVKNKRNYRGINFYDTNNCVGPFGNMIYNSVKYNTGNVDCHKLKFDEVIIRIIQYLSFCVISIVGLNLMNKNELDYDILIVICVYSLLSFKYIINYGKLMDLISNLNLSCYRLFSLIDGNLYVNLVFGNKYSDKCKGVIEFENVVFKYKHNEENILNNCSFKIGANQVVGLMGNNDKKNAILNSISRLYNVNDGIVKIDGVDITEYSENYIRENIALISQNPFLLDMSIMDNLRLLKEDMTYKEIVDICKLLHLNQFIDALPNGYDTVISNGEIELSGDLKQRLGLARALIKNTKIILLDDCNYKDKEMYGVIKKIIRKIRKKHTIIMVSKNSDLIEVCDRVLVINDDGTITD